VTRGAEYGDRVANSVKDPERVSRRAVHGDISLGVRDKVTCDRNVAGNTVLFHGGTSAALQDVERVVRLTVNGDVRLAVTIVIADDRRISRDTPRYSSHCKAVA